jgi:hypothetical protein
MAAGNVVRAFTRGTMRAYYRVVEPSLFALRKQRRLALLGVHDMADLPVASLDMAEGLPECAKQCGRLIEFERRNLDKFLFVDSGNPRSFSRWRGVPQVLDLDLYPDFASYLDKVARRGRGRGASGTRNIKKAQAHGYVIKPIGRAAHYSDMVEVQASKLFRTGGPMIAAIPGVRQAMAGSHPQDDWYGCTRHWGKIWGAFIRERDETGAEREKLAGYCFIRRAGNRLHLILILGHAAHLRNGVVPLLFTEVMRWLLDREDDHVVGLRYFQIGAIEQGRASYLEWKRRFQFQPCVYAWADPPVLAE